MVRFSLTPEEIAFLAEPMKALVERVRQQTHRMPTHEEMDEIERADWEYERVQDAALRHYLEGKKLVMHWWGRPVLVAYRPS